MPVEAGETRPDDTAKVQERFFIDLVASEEFGVVSKIVKEPTEFPKRAVGAVEPAGEGKCFMRGGLEDAKAQSKEGLLRMPAIGRSFDSDQGKVRRDY